MSRLLTTYAMIFVVLIALSGVTYAVFSDKASVLGARFSVGSADIKFLSDLVQGTDPSNLVDDKEGPHFDDVGSSWSDEYLVKLYNNTSTPVLLSSAAAYETANDPDELRSYIYVEIFDWNDVNNNGSADDGEVADTSYGKKTIVKWKTEGFDVGEVGSGSVKGLVLKFSTESLSSSKAGKSGTFDFVFDAVSM